MELGLWCTSPATEHNPASLHVVGTKGEEREGERSERKRDREKEREREKTMNTHNQEI